MSKAVVSAEYPIFAERLRELGYSVVLSESIPCRMRYERYHADLQCLIMDDTAFVLSCCRGIASALKDDYNVVSCGESFGGSYPDNVALSAVRLKDRLICRVSSLDRKVHEYCEKHGIELINVNQGYAKCSCAVVSDNAVITSDMGIYNSIKETNIDVLLTERGRVELSGADSGFIGGASGLDSSQNTLYFCGDITAHPDYDNIKSFCERHGTKIKSLSDGPLTDIGGIVFCD